MVHPTLKSIEVKVRYFEIEFEASMEHFTIKSGSVSVLISLDMSKPRSMLH